MTTKKYKYGVHLFHSEIYLPLVECITRLTEEKKDAAMLSLKVFNEFFGRLHERFMVLMEVEDELCSYDQKLKSKIKSRPLDQIQMDMVNKTEAFNQQIYSTLSSFIKLLSLIQQDFVKKEHIRSNQKFVNNVKEMFKDNIEYDISPLEESLKYRSTYIDHTSQIRHFDWMTYFTGQIAHVIYYEPDESGDYKDITPYINAGNVKIDFQLKTPVKVKNFFITPNHAPVYFALYEFVIAILKNLKINNNPENSYTPKHESYVVGQEYIDDKDQIEVVIKWAFKLPCVVTDFNIDDHPFHVRQTNNKINFNLNKKIPQKLFVDLKNRKPEASQFIVSYIYDIIPRANRELLKRKYIDAHVLLRTFSMFEIEDVFIVNDKGEYVPILWPLPFPPFPQLKNKTEALKYVFIRDLIDTMTYYFSYNFDECIRKIITSLENYFIHYDIKPPRNRNISNLKSFFDYLLNRRKTKFSEQVKYHVVEKNYSYTEKHLQVLRDNIMFIYFLRNKIVHDQLRFKLENEMVCKKGIGTLLYIYQSKQNVKNNLFNYIFSLDMQFKIISDNLAFMNIDWLRKAEKNEKKEKKINDKIIKNKEDMDNWVFGNIKITKKQKRQAIKSS